jgi:hypothetical protein
MDQKDAHSHVRRKEEASASDVPDAKRQLQYARALHYLDLF